MLNDLKIMCKKDHPDAELPEYERFGDAACSLRIIEDYKIYPGKRVLADTGLRIAVPEGFEAQIRPRSGRAWKQGLTVLNTPGTIDSGYRGPVKIILINLGDDPITLEKGEAVAQMKFSPVYTGHFILANHLPDSERGDGGFGSTGK